MYIFIQTPFGQNWIVGKVTAKLSKDLQTAVDIDHVDFSLFNSMHLEKVKIEDREGDTLIYAGEITVRITDWFFLKKHAELKYIGLKDAVVKFQRSDSVWRQQFFFDYFAAPPSTDTVPKTKSGFAFDLKKVELNNVHFLKKDEWLGQDMNIRVGEMLLDAEDLNFSGSKFIINSLALSSPQFHQINYTGRKPKTQTSLVKSDSQTIIEEILENKTDASLQWNKGQLEVLIKDLRITDGIFRTDKKDFPIQPGFDGKHIFFSDINLSLTNSTVQADTIFSKLNLTAKERSGLEVKRFDANFKMSPAGMAFDNLELETNRSLLRRSFSMSYNDMSEMSDFLNKVELTADFENSEVNSDDISFFVPSMKTWKKEISLTGKFRGTVSDLVARDVMIEAGNNTALKGDITMTGLPDIQNTFIDFTANEFRTTYVDAATFVPALRKVKGVRLDKLNTLHFNGSFTGFISDFVTYGNIRTNLGTINTDLNMKLPKGKEPVFAGNIATSNFDLGQLLAVDNLGIISVKADVKGTGLAGLKRNIQASAQIANVEFNGYQYQNINIERGSLVGNLFDGHIDIKDKNVVAVIDGTFDIGSDTPVYQLVADVGHINISRLNLIKDSVINGDSLVFAGKLNLDFTGKNIDEFVGKARIYDATILVDDTPLPFDSLVIATSSDTVGRKLTINSNSFAATLSGEYNVRDVPTTALWFLNKYYPAYISAPEELPKNQNVAFKIETFELDDYLRLFTKKISGFNYSEITGKIDTYSDSLFLNVLVPQFKINQFEFNEANITARGSADSLVLLGETTNILVSDSLSIPLATFSVQSSSNLSKFSLNTSASQAIDNVNLNAWVTTYPDGVGIEFDPSEFVVNGKTWTIDDKGKLEFRQNSDVSGELVLRESFQEINIKTVPSPNKEWSDVLVELKQINLGDFSPFLLPNNRLEGLISGTARIENPTGAMKITSNNLQTQYLRLDNDSIGEMKVEALLYENATKELTVNGQTLNKENHLVYDVNLFFDKEKAVNNKIELKANNFNLSILNRFMYSLFSDIRGNITGDIDVTGPFDGLSISGKGRIKNAGLRVNFTQCFYEILETDINLGKNLIDLNNIVLRDTVTGNPVYLMGGIQHKAFKNMVFDVHVNTQKPGTTDAANNKDVLLLNTTAKDEQPFYGYAKGTGSFSLTGPQTNLQMKIVGVVSNKDSSFITIPPQKEKETGLADFLVEKKYGVELSDSALQKEINNTAIDVTITANPKATVQVLMDEVTGDKIVGKGRGTLAIKSSATQPLTIFGRFDIQEGEYPFTFQSFIKKPFKIRSTGENSNYIQWAGDFNSATVNIDAVYTAERVSYAPLVAASPSTNTNLGRTRGDVDVIVNLSGALFAPIINFELGFPDNSPVKSDQGLQFAIDQLRNDKNEMYKQVTYLIAMNSFAPANGTGAGINVGDIAANTLSGIFMNVITNQINNILGKIFNNDNLTVSFDASVYNRNIIDQTNKNSINFGSNANLSVGYSFFNNRFSVIVSGGIDAPLQSSGGTMSQAVQFLPDVTFEWMINESGTVRASFFYRENADYMTTSASGPGKARKVGGNISYKKEFNSFSEFFNRKKKKETVPPPPSTDTIPTSPSTKPEEEK